MKGIHYLVLLVLMLTFEGKLETETEMTETNVRPRP